MKLTEGQVFCKVEEIDPFQFLVNPIQLSRTLISIILIFTLDNFKSMITVMKYLTKLFNLNCV